LKIYVSHGSVATQLKCGGVFNNYIIAKFLQYVPVKNENRLTFGEDIKNDKVGRFLEHSALMYHSAVSSILVRSYHFHFLISDLDYNR